MKKSITLFFLFASFGLQIFSQASTAGLKFDGIDDKVIVPDHPALSMGNSAFTIEAWIMADTANNGTLAPMVLSKKDKNSTSTDGWLLGLDDKGKLAIQLEGTSWSLGGPGGGWGGGSGVTAIDLRDGQCHHIAWTRELGVGSADDTLRAYQDSKYVKKSKKSISKINVSNDDELWIGASEFNENPDIYQFQGSIKEIRIWNIHKTDAQIASDYSKPMTGNEAGLVAYWKLNENTGTTASDYSKNKIHGAITGPVWGTSCDVAALGIETLSEYSEVILFPNPANGMLNVRLEGNHIIDGIRVYDINGKSVLNQRWSGNGPLDISVLKHGIYLIELRKGDQTVHKSVLNKN